MIRRATALCATVVAVAGLAYAGAPAAYKSDQGYAITPAGGWTVEHSGVNDFDIFLYGPEPKHGFREKMYVVIKPMYPPYDLNELLSDIRRQMRNGYPHKFSHFHLITDGFGKVASTPCYEMTSTYDLGEQPLHVRSHQVFIVHGNHIYTFTCLALDSNYAKYEKAFNSMIQSVQWIKEKRHPRSIAPEGPA
jgi:hypothetical protein